MTNNAIDKFKRDCFLSLQFFTEAYFHWHKMAYRKTGYHKSINNNIQKTLMWQNDKRHLLINVPPRCGKSLALRLSIAWGVFTSNGNYNAIIATYAGILASHHLASIRDVIDTDFFKTLTDGQIRISMSEASKELCGIQKRIDNSWVQTGQIRSCAMSAPITGFGACVHGVPNSGAIFIDDPQKAGATQLEMQSAIEKFNTVLRSRLNDQEHGPVIAIQQRLSVRDFSNYILETEPDLWKHLNYPVINSENKLLDPNLYNHTFIEQLRRADESVFQAQYQQSPLSDDIVNPFNMGKLKLYTETPDLSGFQIVMAADYATSEKTSADYSAIFVCAIKGQECVVIDYNMQKTNVVDTINITSNLIKKWRPTMLIIEKGSIANMIIPQIDAKNIENGCYCRTETYARITDKLTMSTGLISAWNNGYIQMPTNIDPKIVKQFELFPSIGEHDDAIDALAGIYCIDVKYNPHVLQYDYDVDDADLEGFDPY